MAERWFLKIDGISGESTDAAHKGEIDVQSWSWGVSSSVGAGSGSGGGGSGSGGGSGRAVFEDFHFVSRISTASPPLLSACATGVHFKQATLSGVRGGSGKSKSADYLKYKLSDVTVRSVQQYDSEDQVPSEQFSLNYSKVEVTYSPQTSSAAAGTPVTFGFDVKSNKKI